MVVYRLDTTFYLTKSLFTYKNNNTRVRAREPNKTTNVLQSHIVCKELVEPTSVIESALVYLGYAFLQRSR